MTEGGIQVMPTQFYECYFNYDLNTHTWRNVVNKQILQTYQRLLIEKQLKAIESREKKLRDEIDKVDN